MPPKNVILSIKPQYALQVIEGVKTVELRRKFPMNNIKGGIAIIYASSPLKEIIGYAYITDVQKLSISSIWKEYSKESRVTKKFFYSYFNGVDEGFAVILGKPVKFKVPIRVKDLAAKYNFSPPQSYQYASERILEVVEV
jgi:predicted transcriptional regulator